ncbi:hypothetical protein BHE74_00004323 [Ensete ventricosum]|nr:hypothetical protein BHE74_00004323 [Ensete ventricosum]
MGEIEYPNSLNSRRRAKRSNLAFSTLKRTGEVEYLSSLTYPAEELCISSFDYSTTMAESDWEPKGHVAAKAED